MPTFMVLFILSCGRIMTGYQETFDQVYILGNVANRGVSDILDIYTLRVGLENFRFSYATALDFFKAVINLSLLLSVNWVSRKLTDMGLF
jgi:putative aldouronate transport system permease protein